LNECDLLYLPLAFESSAGLGVDSLRDVMPTKAVDYLFAGREILVHAPADFELTRFFRRHRAAHIVDAPGAAPLSEFCAQYLAGNVGHLSAEDVAGAAAQFDPERNFEILTRFLVEAVRS
jgi:hypothetical protein